MILLGAIFDIKVFWTAMIPHKTGNVPAIFIPVFLKTPSKTNSTAMSSYIVDIMEVE
jgi:hypothetical protein